MVSFQRLEVELQMEAFAIKVRCEETNQIDIILLSEG